MGRMTNTARPRQGGPDAMPTDAPFRSAHDPTQGKKPRVSYSNESENRR
jgi:hypothetical protein